MCISPWATFCLFVFFLLFPGFGEEQSSGAVPWGAQIWSKNCFCCIAIYWATYKACRWKCLHIVYVSRPTAMPSLLSVPFKVWSLPAGCCNRSTRLAWQSWEVATQSWSSRWRTSRARPRSWQTVLSKLKRLRTSCSRLVEKRGCFCFVFNVHGEAVLWTLRREMRAKERK